MSDTNSTIPRWSGTLLELTDDLPSTNGIEFEPPRMTERPVTRQLDDFEGTGLRLLDPFA